jgi:hypothetical protein
MVVVVNRCSSCCVRVYVPQSSRKRVGVEFSGVTRVFGFRHMRLFVSARAISQASSLISQLSDCNSQAIRIRDYISIVCVYPSPSLSSTFFKHLFQAFMACPMKSTAVSLYPTLL